MTFHLFSASAASMAIWRPSSRLEAGVQATEGGVGGIGSTVLYVIVYWGLASGWEASSGLLR